MMNKGNFSIKANPIGKTVDIEVTGTFTPEKAEQFIQTYKANVSKVKPAECELKLNCLNLDLVTQEMIPHLENCYLLYKQTGFKKVTVNIKKNPILKMQLNRLARNVQLPAFEIVEV